MIDNEVDKLNESAACENFDDFIDYLEGEATDKKFWRFTGILL